LPKAERKMKGDRNEMV